MIKTEGFKEFYSLPPAVKVLVLFAAGGLLVGFYYLTRNLLVMLIFITAVWLVRALLLIVRF